MNIIALLPLYNEIIAIDEICQNISENQKAEILAKIPDDEQKQLIVCLTKLRNCTQEYMDELQHNEIIF